MNISEALNYLNRKNLNEAIEVDGAELIATARGFDIFRILTFDAAQEFTKSDTNIPAGDHFVQNRATFDDNINDDCKLYFFVPENTNHVEGAILTGQRGSIKIRNADNTKTVQIDLPFAFENTSQRNDISSNLYLPIDFVLDAENKDPISPCIVRDNRLVAVLPQFNPGIFNEEITLDQLLDEADFNIIEPKAFTFSTNFRSLEITPAGITFEENSLLGINQINIQAIEEGQRSNNIYYNNFAPEANINWDFNLTPEEREARRRAEEERLEQERLEQERLERERIERERREEEERLERQRREEEERLEQERLEKERMLNGIWYEKTKNGIKITGCDFSLKNLDIPEEIEGKPVTIIGSYAFYAHNNLERLTLPSTLKKIEKYAIANCDKVMIKGDLKRDIILGKNWSANSYNRVRFI